MPQISVLSELPTVYTNHCIRATTATAMARQGHSLNEIASVTGHRSLDSVKLYIGRPDVEAKSTFNASLSDYANNRRAPHPPVTASVGSATATEPLPQPLDVGTKSLEKPTTIQRPAALAKSPTKPKSPKSDGVQENDVENDKNALAIQSYDDTTDTKNTNERASVAQGVLVEKQENAKENAIEYARNLISGGTFSNCTFQIKF